MSTVDLDSTKSGLLPQSLNGYDLDPEYDLRQNISPKPEFRSRTLIDQKTNFQKRNEVKLSLFSII